MSSLTENRSAVLDREFENFIFDRDIEAVGSWEPSSDDAWSRRVYFQGETEPGDFTVVFSPASDEVTDISALLNGQPVGQVSDMPALLGMI